MPTLNITLKVQKDQHVPPLFKFKRSSFGPNNTLNFTIQKEDGSARDLTGFTLEMHLFEVWRRIDIFERILEIVVAADGTAKYEPKDGDFDLLRDYYFRVSLEDSSNKEWTEEALFKIQ